MSMNGRRRLELEMTRLDALRLEQARQECAALVEACEEALRKVRDVAVQQLAAPGLRASVDALRALRDRVNEAPDTSRAELLHVASDIQQTITAAEAQARAWSEAQARAVAEARHAQALAAASGDASAPASEASRLGQEAATEAERGNLDAASRLTRAARHAAERASAAVLDERVRKEIVKSLVRTLKDMGFITIGPHLDAGVVVLEGRLASGRRARFEVKLDGETTFDLDGYQGRSCADDMEKVEITLRDRFGVKLGPPQVVWKNPDRLGKGARDLPAGGTARKR